MHPIPLGTLADWMGGRVDREHRWMEVSGVSIDSRTLQPGDVFFAVRGARDGHDFVGDASSRGAAAAVVRDGFAGDGPLVRVVEPRAALGKMAAAYRRTLSSTFVGITGSVGKTTTRSLLAHILSGSRRIVQAPASFNNDLGLPLTVLMAGGVEKVVLCELGTSAPGEIAALAAIAAPEIGVLTRVAPAHLDGLRDMAGVEAEKGALVRALGRDGILVYNADDDACCRLARGHSGRSVGCTVTGRNGASFSLDARGRSEEGFLCFEVAGAEGRTRLHHPSSVALALATARELGLEVERALVRLRDFEPLRGRGRVIDRGGVALVDETYNASPHAVAAAIRVLASRDAVRRVAVLGEMHELGARSEELHLAAGEIAASVGLDRLVVVGPLAGAIARGAIQAGMPRESVLLAPDPLTAAGFLEDLRPGDAVLFKASRRVHMERALDAVESRLSGA